MHSINPQDIDPLLIRLDYLIFGDHPTVMLEQIMHPILTDLLQIAYTTYYFIPVIYGIVLLSKQKRDEFDRSIFLILFFFYLSYLGYILFPALGPRFSIDHLQTRGLQGFLIAEPIQQILNRLEGIKRDAFPSGHTAVTVLVLYCAYRYESYRKVEKELDEVDLMGVVPTPLDLYLPLGLDKLVKIYPKSIIVCAGASNMGKTALAHDFIKHNMDRHDCRLFFSEGGVESLRDRLEKHQDRMIGEWKFKAYPRMKNFEDVVGEFPDSVNVIDYLLVPDEFWKVGQYLDDIYRKLNKGVC